MLEFALDYARRGWPVFPCKPTDKSPWVKTKNIFLIGGPQKTFVSGEE
jgi:hypothetical protein